MKIKNWAATKSNIRRQSSCGPRLSSRMCAVLDRKLAYPERATLNNRKKPLNFFLNRRRWTNQSHQAAILNSDILDSLMNSEQKLKFITWWKTWKIKKLKLQSLSWTYEYLSKKQSLPSTDQEHRRPWTSSGCPPTHCRGSTSGTWPCSRAATALLANLPPSACRVLYNSVVQWQNSKHKRIKYKRSEKGGFHKVYKM